MSLSRDDLKKVYAERAETIGKSARSAYAETILELVNPNHLSLDIFSAFMPVEQLNPGDNLQRRVRKGKYKVRTMVPGSMHLTDKTTYQDQFFYMFDRLIAGTAHSLWEVQSGDIGTVENMRRELQADITDEIVSRVFTLLGTVWNASDTPNNYADASSGGLTSTILDNMIENVMDFAGGVRAIVGTRRALLPVYEFALYKEFALTGTNTDAVGFAINDRLNEWANTGRVGTYRGARLVELPNIRRNRLPGVDDLLLDTTKVIVVGNDPGKIALMGGFDTQDYTDFRTQPANYVLHGWQAYSMFVDSPEQIGVIKVAASS
jgi:hypothetical protein